VVSKIAPNLLGNVWKSFPDGVTVVTGSAGKSSTTKMLVAIARAHGKEVFTNPTTANILQGFFASILEVCDWRGRVKGDCAILEVDEGHAAEILRTAKAKFVTILNVTDDQLDSGAGCPVCSRAG
jgi:UDP-N-acetylmuramoylalanine-D-glutamate ligase